MVSRSSIAQAAAKESLSGTKLLIEIYTAPRSLRSRGQVNDEMRIYANFLAFRLVWTSRNKIFLVTQ